MKLSASLLSLFTLFSAAAAQAQEAVPNLAEPWQLGMVKPATPVMETLYTTHDYLLIMCVVISVFVLVMLFYICMRYNRKANPKASKVVHNTKLEIVWTVVPILILIAIAIPSLRAHYVMEDDTDPGMTLKVVGYQWYWNYEYPDHGGFSFDSYMKKKEDLKPGEPRLLAVDNHVVVPVNTKVVVHITGGDVLHAWAVPAFGVKRDAVPGRLNTSWFKATRTGTFYGQCSELCGVGHGFMPIRVDVVEQEEFDAWVLAKQEEAGIDPASLNTDGEEAAPEEGAKAEGEVQAESGADETSKPTADKSKASEAPAKSEEQAEQPKAKAEKIKEAIQQKAEETPKSALKPVKKPKPEAQPTLDKEEVWVEEGWGEDETN